MIHYPLDESYCIDHFSIIEVKCDKAAPSKKENLIQQLRFYRNHLQEVIGDELFSDILNSIEYKKLKHANLKIFETVDNLKKYNINAQAVDQLNHLRWQIKNEIQIKFFGKPTNEIKLGYKKYES